MKPRPAKRRRRLGARGGRSGFTLLELLVASAMMAVLGVALYATLTVGYRGRSVAEAQVRAVREATIAMQIVEQDFAGVLPPRGILAGPFIGYAMGLPGAEADSVEFHALGRDMTAEHDPLSDGIRRVQLRLWSDGSSPVLVRRVERNLLAPTQREAMEEVISRNVRAFGVRYFDGLGWVQEWDSTQREDSLPLAVEVSMEFDVPSPTDRSRYYRVRHVIPLSAAGVPDLSELELLGAEIE